MGWALRSAASLLRLFVIPSFRHSAGQRRRLKNVVKLASSALPTSASSYRMMSKWVGAANTPDTPHAQNAPTTHDLRCQRPTAGPTHTRALAVCRAASVPLCRGALFCIQFAVIFGQIAPWAGSGWKPLSPRQNPPRRTGIPPMAAVVSNR